MSRKRPIIKIILAICLCLLLIAGGVAFYLYQQIYTPNVIQHPTKAHLLYIPSNATYNTLKDSLASLLINPTSFDRVAQQMNLSKHIHPGKYRIKAGLSNRALIQQLRAGQDEEVKVVVNNARTLDEIAGKVTQNIEADSLSLINYLNSPVFLDRYKLDKKSLIAIFIPDTYSFDWATSSEDLMKRLYKEYQKFWTEERLAQAKKQNRSPLEVISLASIVQEETIKEEEMSDIAGVYLNRLEKGWLLQADPTVKFALQDFELRRILFKHLEYDSPYNTYKYAGLPPGPICIPSKKALQAVLQPKAHDYMYFCAKEDFSGYHTFAKNLKQHNLNAKKYHLQLKKRKIK